MLSKEEFESKYPWSDYWIPLIEVIKNKPPINIELINLYCDFLNQIGILEDVLLTEISPNSHSDWTVEQGIEILDAIGNKLALTQ